MRRATAVLVAILVLTAACGADDGAGSPAAQTSTEDTTPETLAPDTSAPDGGQEPTTTDRGQPATTRAGSVTVTTESGRYAKAAPITLTVANGLSRSIYTENLKTDCSIVQLERRAGSQWERVGECNADQAVQVVEIAPGKGRTVTVETRGVDMPTGEYHAVLAYRFAPGPEGEAPEQTVSAPFRIDA